MKKFKYLGFEILINENGKYIFVDGIKRTPYLIVPQRSTKGFLQVWLGEGKKAYVHKLVALAYLGKSDKKLVLHKDTNTRNNHYTNLMYGDYKDVIQNMKKANRFWDRHRRSHFIKSEEDYNEAIEMLKAGKTLSEIAKRFNTSDMSIHRFKKAHHLEINT